MYATLCYFVTLCYSTLCHTTLRYSMLLYTILCYATLHYSALRYSMLQYSTLLYSMLRIATLCYATLCYAKNGLLSFMLLYFMFLYTTLLYATLHYTMLLQASFCYSTLHCSTLRYSALLYVCYSTLVYATVRYATPCYSTLHYATLCYCTLLYTSLLYSILCNSTLRTQQIDSMLPCICPVIDHRWRQNVVRTKKVAHKAIICDLLLDRCTETWNLFVLCTKALNFVRIKAAFFYLRCMKVGPSPFWQTRKKQLASSMIYTKCSNPIGCKSHHCQTWLTCCFSWNENLQRSKNWTAKSTILKENTGKVESVFVIRSAQWAIKLGCCPE